MGRIAGEAAEQILELQLIGGVVDLRGAQERRKQFVEGGVETGESTLEELKTPIEVSRESHADVLGALGSGEALDTMAESLDLGVDAQVDLSRVSKSAVADVGISEHLGEREFGVIPGSGPGSCHVETRRTRSRVPGSFEKNHREEQVRQFWLSFLCKTRPMEILYGE